MLLPIKLACGELPDKMPVCHSIFGAWDGRFIHTFIDIDTNRICYEGGGGGFDWKVNYSTFIRSRNSLVFCGLVLKQLLKIGSVNHMNRLSIAKNRFFSHLFCQKSPQLTGITAPQESKSSQHCCGWYQGCIVRFLRQAERITLTWQKKRQCVPGNPNTSSV